MRTRKQLEQLAITAHAVGDDWATFWPTVASDVAALHRWDLDNAPYRRTVARLSCLLVAGDLDGREPVPATWGQPEAWELDDAAPIVPVVVASDSATAAKIDWQAAGVAPAAAGRPKA